MSYTGSWEPLVYLIHAKCQRKDISCPPKNCTLHYKLKRKYLTNNVDLSTEYTLTLFNNLKNCQRPYIAIVWILPALFFLGVREKIHNLIPIPSFLHPKWLSLLLVEISNGKKKRNHMKFFYKIENQVRDYMLLGAPSSGFGRDWFHCICHRIFSLHYYWYKKLLVFPFNKKSACFVKIYTITNKMCVLVKNIL